MDCNDRKTANPGVSQPFSLLWGSGTQYSCWMESYVFHIHTELFGENSGAVHGQETAAPRASPAPPPFAPRSACSRVLRSLALAPAFGFCLSAVEDGIAQQPSASAVLLPGGGGGPGFETLLKWLLSCP